MKNWFTLYTLVGTFTVPNEVNLLPYPEQEMLFRALAERAWNDDDSWLSDIESDPDSPKLLRGIARKLLAA